MSQSSDDDEKLQYLKEGLLSKQSPIRKPPFTPAARDDDSNLFMSEPSISEVDELSERHSRLLSPFGSFSGDEGDNDGLPPPPPPPARLIAPPSPGNTSLSSWESPHPSRRIHVHYSPGGDSTSLKAESISSQQNLYNRKYPYRAASPPPPYPVPDFQFQAAQLPPMPDAKTPDRSFVNSSNSTSPASEGKRKSLDTFLDDIRGNSEGQMRELPGANVSFGSSTYVGPPNATGKSSSGLDFTAILRGRPQTQNPQSIPSRGNGAHGQSSTGRGTNDTVVMVLSDDSGDEGAKANQQRAKGIDDEEKVSADDEKTASEQPKQYLRNSRSFGASSGRSGTAGVKGHRRQRSGDAAAATLSTGSNEWKGMTLDNIPVPGGEDEDDDEDDRQDSKIGDEQGDRPRSNDMKNKASKTEKLKVGSSIPGTFRATIDKGEGFSIGTGYDKSHDNQKRPSRNRQKRDSYRGRRLAGLAIDSEDSSSLTSGSRLPPESRRNRNTSLPASAYSGYMASPDWSAASARQQQQRGGHPLHWSPRSFNSQQHNSHISLDYDEYSRYNQHLFEAPLLGNQHAQQARDNNLGLDGRIRSRSQSIDMIHFQGQKGHRNIETAFSWLSGRDEVKQAPSFYPGSEMSPLMGSGSQKYGFTQEQNLSQRIAPPPQHMPGVVVDQGDRAQPKVDLSPFLKQGRKVFAASPFSNIVGKRFGKDERRKFLPHSVTENEDKYQTFVCPICQTRQREFFTVTNAPRQFESASGYIAFYFGIYVISALYVFGLQEGWGKLDCIYFAVITLTTAGLGDFVPTSDGAKVVCSIFIYFGVACIGLLLGSYIAGMLDESSRRAAHENRIKSCPNCVRIQNIREAAERRRKQFKKEKKQHREYFASARAETHPNETQHDSKRVKRISVAEALVDISHSEKGPMTPPPSEASHRNRKSFTGGSNKSVTTDPPRSNVSNDGSSRPANITHFHSPSTAKILRRQAHSRHTSMDIGAGNLAGLGGASKDFRRTRRLSADLGSIPATVPEPAANYAPPPRTTYNGVYHAYHQTEEDDNDDNDDTSSSMSSSASSEESIDLENQFSGVRNARYVFLTLREALVNSLVIIGTGCVGFYFIEGFSFIDSWYFTTVLLTTVGYGDLVPYTRGGKLFATIYILVAGTILLNNMSMISMIPLELRRRRTEQAVLTQFGDSLDDSALRELATGPLIRRLNLATEHTLDECTREMFCLAMLVRLGKVTEEDIKLTFAAFRKLDVNDEGVLNSRAIIAGMIQKRKSRQAMNMAPAGQGTSSVPIVPAPTSRNEYSNGGGTYGSTQTSGHQDTPVTTPQNGTYLNYRVYWGTSS